MPVRRRTCKTCSRFLQPWGKTVSGKKRFRCKHCNTTRLYHLVKKDHFELFRQYVLWGMTYRVLGTLSGLSMRSLEKQFHQFFQQDPPFLPLVDQSSLDEAYLLIDGLWFGRWFVLMVYRQHKDLRILHIAVAGREVTTKITTDLKHMVEVGYRFSGIVSDGGTGIVGAVHLVFSHTPHQICLAHMHRDIVAALGRYPKDMRVRELKVLADHVWLIESREALTWWQDEVEKWYRKNWQFLMERRYDTEGNWWYIHKGVRKALRIMMRLSTTSFTFLRYPLMPKTTNELEAQFGHLGKRWLAHRGLKKERWEQFLKWFVFFYNQDKLSSRKTK